MGLSQPALYCLNSWILVQQAPSPLGTQFHFYHIIMEEKQLVTMSVDDLRKLRKKIEKAAEEVIYCMLLIHLEQEGSSETLLDCLDKLKLVAVSRSLIKVCDRYLNDAL